MTARHLRAVDAAPRWGIAVRVSQVMGRSGESFHSPATQEAAARRAVEAAGGVIDETVGERGVFYDLDVSGKTAPSDRPGMGEALELVRQGRLSGVAVYDASRWSRDTVSGLRELQEIAACGGHVISAAEMLDVNTPHGMFSTTIFLAAAQLKRDEASKAWKVTHQSRHDRGLPHGKVPLGYVAARGEVLVDPVLGPVITQAFEDYAAGRVSQKGIAERLTEARGVLTRQGVVSKALRNPFVTGLLTYNGDVKVGRHTPLVPMDVFDRVQARLADDRYASPRLRAPESFLSGLLHCHCGHVLYRRGRGARRADGIYLTRLRCPVRECSGVGAPFAHEVERAVKEMALAMARDEVDEMPRALARRAAQAQAGAEVAVLRAQEKALTDSIGNAAALLAKGVLDEFAYAGATRGLRDELRSTQERLQSVEKRARPTLSVEALASLADQAERFWDDMTAVEQREFVGLFLRAVTLRPAAYRGQEIADRLDYEEMAT